MRRMLPFADIDRLAECALVPKRPGRTGYVSAHDRMRTQLSSGTGCHAWRAFDRRSAARHSLERRRWA